jgi:hypothetical protein
MEFRVSKRREHRLVVVQVNTRGIGDILAREKNWGW